MTKPAPPMPAVALFAGPAAFAPQSPDPSGVWVRDDGIARCGGDICATNLWIRDTGKGEAVGDRLVMSLASKAAGRLAGTAYDRKRDRTDAITLDVTQNRLLTRGCVLGGLLCRNASWTPVN
ncbi:DUF2147 domain-containing protein [Rhizobium sp. TRM95111]|uniref:DUF2147 domain-containing protein n=1 Tax=Rhizobium alarense TaxID=2846851 RepID=UPI001F2018AD|nr:DUF2147 domain-containing protein [Rhizobium alarense]MCF3641865.1 DUF2147 domain-containing protein [Rhizobium alarense]